MRLQCAGHIFCCRVLVVARRKFLTVDDIRRIVCALLCMGMCINGFPIMNKRTCRSEHARATQWIKRARARINSVRRAPESERARERETVPQYRATGVLNILYYVWRCRSPRSSPDARLPPKRISPNGFISARGNINCFGYQLCVIHAGA